MIKKFRKIIEHKYEIDEEKLREAVLKLNNKYHYKEVEYLDSVDVFCDLADIDFEILVNGYPETVADIETFFDFDFYTEIENTLCDMIEEIAKDF